VSVPARTTMISLSWMLFLDLLLRLTTRNHGLTHYPGCCAHTPELKYNCRSPQQQRLVHNHILQIVATTSHAGYMRGSTNLRTLCSCARCIIMNTDSDICVCVCACLRMCVCVSQDSRSLLILAISKLELITHRDTHWTGSETCSEVKIAFIIA